MLAKAYARLKVYVTLSSKGALSQEGIYVLTFCSEELRDQASVQKFGMTTSERFIFVSHVSENRRAATAIVAKLELRQVV